MSNPHQPLFDAISRFRASWFRRGWSYDRRFESIACSFNSESAEQARTLLRPLLPYSWTNRTLAGAPPVFVAIAERTGGIRSAQMILGGDRVGHLTPYGLWWPWEEGQTVSLRIGIEGGSPSDMYELANIFGTDL